MMQQLHTVYGTTLSTVSLCHIACESQHVHLRIADELYTVTHV